MGVCSSGTVTDWLFLNSVVLFMIMSLFLEYHKIVEHRNCRAHILLCEWGALTF